MDALTTSLTCIRQLLLVVLLYLAGMGGAAAAPLAGSIISNQAEASYRDDALGVFETVLSNRTELIVAPVTGITLVPDLVVAAAPGETVILPHQLSNTGNITTDITLSHANPGGDDFDLLDVRLVQDLNGNGIDDTGEPVLSPGGTVTLAPGAAINLLLVGIVPSGAAPGQKSALLCNATNPDAAVRVTAFDTVEVVAGPVINFTKRANVAATAPGGVVEFTLTGTNVGAEDAGPVLVHIDGVATERLIVRDPVPTNTVFRGFTDAGISQPLYHVLGDALHDYRSVPPADLTTVDAVAFAYASAPAGFSFEVSFSEGINENATEHVTNQASLHYTNSGHQQVLDSNRVVIGLPASEPVIDYYADNEFASTTRFARSGDPLHLGVDAGACNTDAAVIERYTVTLAVNLSGDRESGFEIIETAANSGRFELANVPTRHWPTAPVLAGNNLLEVGGNDVVSASMVCGGATLTADLLIDPAGVVFDSRSNLPLANATVTLIGVSGDGSEFVPEVFDMDGSPVSNRMITGPDGQFQFPLVAPGNYRLDILAPNGYSFPSVLSPALMPPDRIIDPSGSYGGLFAVTPETGPVYIDMPLDPGPVDGLMVEKTASRTTAALGETVIYTIKASNQTGLGLFEARLVDVLPAGFAYQPGTARLDGVSIDDPRGAPGSRLTFELGTLLNNAETIISYRVQIRPGALRGDGVNSAQVISREAVSNVAKARVRVLDDVFRDEALILGKLYVDCNGNRLQEGGEPGIPGVRVYLEDGTFSVSDSEGKYSFVGISPRTHVLKIDSTTLPAGAKLAALGNRHAGDPHSRFADLKKGELHRADFAEGSCTPAVLERVRQRRASGEVLVAEHEQRLTQELRADGEQARVDPRTRPASGVLEGDGRIVDYRPLFTEDSPDATVSNLPARPRTPAATVSLESLVPELDPAPGFIGLRDGDTLPGRQISVQVKGRAGTQLLLRVNGEELPDQRVGQKVTMPERSVQAWEYVAVGLEAGVNALELRQVDAFGNARGGETIEVIAPGKLGRLVLSVPESGVPADGHTPAPVVVRLLDDRGVPVTARTPVTLEAGAGRWDVADLDPRTPGIQAFVEGGEALFDLLPPQQPGDARVRVSSGVLEAEARLVFLPDLRPLIAVGVVEGAMNFSRLDEGELEPATRQDSFEEEIRELSFGADDDRRGGVRGALFLKGKVRGEYLLTLSYDSDKDTNDRLFRDIQPDAFYPVYGDSAIKGFDAQSSDRLYVRIDKGRSYMLYGDYTTQADGEARRLGNYSRSLNGLRSHYETQRTALNLFAAYDDSRQRVIEVPGRGLSGPYELDAGNIIENSEQVEILTRDRNQPGLVLKREPMARFGDYSINPVDGTLLFRRPVPSVDAHLNPISIRVAFEVEEGGEDFWVYGFDGQLRVTEAIEVGASVVRDAKPEDEFNLYSTNLTVRLGEHGVLVGEVARSDHEDGAQGDARRIEYRHRGEQLDARVYASDADEAFDNPSASISAGRREAGARASYRLDERSRLAGELLYSEDRASEGRRRGALVTVDRSLTDSLRLEAGLHHARETATPALPESAGTTPRETTSVRAGLGWQPEFLPRANLSLEYEQDVSDSGRKLAALSGEYQLADRGRLYLRHEFISSLTGAYGLSESARGNHNTVFGVDYDYMDAGQLFSEYRLRDAFSGREAEAAIGLRNAWNLAEGLRLHTGFERVQAISGEGDETAALTGAIEYTADPLWKGTARLELRQSDSTENLLSTLGYARKIDPDWTVLARNAFTLDRDRDSDDRYTRERLQLGLAYRDTDTNRWQALARYEFSYEEDEANAAERRVHLWSGHANYQPTSPLTLSGRYAGKWVREEDDDFSSDFTAHLLSGRIIYDLSERWDAGVTGSILFTEGLDSRQYGLGVEAGYRVNRNLWLSAGYNFFGFEDEDLGGDDTNPGVYVRMRFKFDEALFDWLR